MGFTNLFGGVVGFGGVVAGFANAVSHKKALGNPWPIKVKSQDAVTHQSYRSLRTRSYGEGPFTARRGLRELFFRFFVVGSPHAGSQKHALHQKIARKLRALTVHAFGAHL